MKNKQILNSEFSGFYRPSMANRLTRLKERTGLMDEDLRVFSGEEGLSPEQADHMVENTLGTVAVPLGLCVNLRVNDRDWFVPMAIEECSVIAAASHAAKLLRGGKGIQAEVTSSKMKSHFSPLLFFTGPLYVTRTSI